MTKAWHASIADAISCRLASLRWLKAPLAIFVFSRAAILLVTHWSLVLDPRVHAPDHALDIPSLQGLCRWDCGFFLAIATSGYSEPHLSNFFPLFPLLGRGVHALTALPLDVCLVLVANFFGLVGLAAVYRVFADLDGEDVAVTGTALLASWPFSFFQASAHPESMMLAFSALAILYAQRRQYLRSGVAFGLGLLSRHLVVFTGGALAVAKLREGSGFRAGRLLFSRASLGILVAAAMASVYPFYLYARFGDPIVWLKASYNWGGSSPWLGVAHFVRIDGWHTPYAVYMGPAIVLAIATLFLLRTPRYWILAGYAIPLLCCLLLVGLAALGRYTQSVWPAFLPMAAALSSRPAWKLAVISFFAIMQGMFLYLFAHIYPIL